MCHNGKQSHNSNAITATVNQQDSLCHTQHTVILYTDIDDIHEVNLGQLKSLDAAKTIFTRQVGALPDN